jgi:hypothetical protein
VRFCLSHWDLPNHHTSCCTTFHAALLICSEISCWVWVHWLALRLFGAMVWKLLIIEPFSQWKLNKIKTENCIRIWGAFWCCWKALIEPDLIKFISQFSELRCRRYWHLSGFCCWKFKQIAKNWVWKEKVVEPSMCSHIAEFRNFQFWKCEK